MADIPGALGKAGYGVFDEIGQCLIDAGQHKQQGVFGQIVEQGGRVFKKQRQIGFDARRNQALTDLFVHGAAGRIPFEAVAPITAKQGNAFFVERELTRGEQGDFCDRIGRALGFRIKQPQSFDFIVEQIDSHRLAHAHREHIDQSAAQRKFAGLHHLADRQIARIGELLAVGLTIKRVACLEQKTVAGHERRRCQTL